MGCYFFHIPNIVADKSINSGVILKNTGRKLDIMFFYKCNVIFWIILGNFIKKLVIAQ